MATNAPQSASPPAPPKRRDGGLTTWSAPGTLSRWPANTTKPRGSLGCLTTRRCGPSCKSLRQSQDSADSPLVVEQHCRRWRVAAVVRAGRVAPGGEISSVIDEFGSQVGLRRHRVSVGIDRDL